MSGPRVRFVIGGVQKAGTSALARYMSSHPRLRLPADKEAHVFDAPDFQDAWSPEEVDRRYAAHFDAEPDARTVEGDATPIYLLHPRFVERIARYNPAMRWLVLLRDPAERAVSHYRMERDRGHERWPMWAAFLLERWRLRGHQDDFALGSPLRHHSYRLRGDYARQLEVLYAHFPRGQVLLLDNRALRDDPTGTLRSACRFLGVEPLPGELPRERVFVGNYAALPHDGLRMRLLRFLMRRELRRMRAGHGLRFDP